MSFKNFASRICLVAVDVRSAHNVGSLFRTCDGFGADLFLVGICPTPARPFDTRLPHIVQQAEKQIAKTALGAEKSVHWQYAQDFLSCSELLKNHGYFVVALEQSATSMHLRRLKPTNNAVAIVVGREVDGLSDAELALCEAAYEIPMQGKKESFNVVVAAGIALYQLAIVEKSTTRLIA